MRRTRCRATALAHRAAAVAVLVVGILGLVLLPASAQLPGDPVEELTEFLDPSEEPTEEPTEDPTGEPSDGAATQEPTHEPGHDAPEPTPSASGSGPDSGSATTGGADGSDQPGADPTASGGGPHQGTGDLGGFDVYAPAGGDEADGSMPAPEVAPGRTTGTVPAAAPVPLVPATTPVLDGVSRFAAAIPGAYGFGILAALLGVGVLTTTFMLTDRGWLLTARDADGGIDVTQTRRWRVLAGGALLALAAIVGVVGYLRISLEPQVPVQLVYLASAGFAVVVLAAAGGALLIAEQLRADESRISDLEHAITMLADRLAPQVSEPPRLRDRRE